MVSEHRHFDIREVSRDAVRWDGLVHWLTVVAGVCVLLLLLQASWLQGDHGLTVRGVSLDHLQMREATRTCRKCKKSA